jgi:hypothetical protein
LPAKIRSDEAESAGFGGSKLQDDNEVSADFHPSDEDLSLGTPEIFAATLRAGANFPDFFVARRFSNRLQRAPRASNSKKLAPGADPAELDDRPWDISHKS